MRRACLAIFFLNLRLGELCTRGRLEPASGGNRRRGIPAGQSSRRDQCTGTGSFQSAASVCAYGQTCAHYIPSEPQPPQHTTTTTRTTTTTTTTVQSGEAPKLGAQPSSNYPALCRQDTASPWSTDYRGNIKSETMIQMQAMKRI